MIRPPGSAPGAGLLAFPFLGEDRIITSGYGDDDVMRHAIVTGATGFIGQHLVRRLAASGVRVRCLVHHADFVGCFDDLDVTYAVGDVTAPGALARLLPGVQTVYHLAGATLARTAAEFDRTNATGTRLVAESCAAMADPPVLVFVSSLAAAGPSPFDQPRIEAQPPAPVSKYGRSKLAAERALKELADRMPISVIRPPSVYGPRELYMLDMFRTVSRGWNVIPGRQPMRMSLVHVQDVVEAMILAAERGKRLSTLPGDSEEATRGTYFVAGRERPTFRELGDLVGEAVGRDCVRSLHMPLPLCHTVGLIGETVSRVHGKPGLLNRDKMREAAAGSWTCLASRAENELGFTPRANLTDGLRQTARWYFDNGWVREPKPQRLTFVSAFARLRRGT